MPQSIAAGSMEGVRRSVGEGEHDSTVFGKYLLSRERKNLGIAIGKFCYRCIPIITQ